MSSPFPVEFALVAACCRWPRSDSAVAAIRIAANAVDWPRVERVATRHRVTALVYDGLRAAGIDPPSATLQHFATAAKATAANGLGMAREELRLQQAFDAHGIPSLLIKGTSLGMLAYGSVGVKEAWDIDLLVMPAQALLGRGVLEGLGYHLVEALPDAGFARYVAVAKETVFHHPALGVWVELHWRLTDNRLLLPTIDAVSATQDVSLAGRAIRTLGDEALFAYLCVHGTVHAWFRLKWLADVAAFLASRDVAHLYRSAIALGAGRTSAVTLLLCADLFQLALPAALKAEIGNDRVVRALVNTARRALTFGHAEGEIQLYSTQWWRMTAAQSVLVADWRFFASELARQWTSVPDRTAIALPRSLGFVYHLLRIPLWLARFARRARRVPNGPA